MNRIILCVLLLCPLWARGVRVEFDPQQPSIGPFPNDFVTTPDSRQKTGRRVNLDTAGCRGDECNELRLLNEFDGFNVQARLTVRFSANIDTATLRSGIHYVWLDTAWNRPFSLAPTGSVTAINRVVYERTSRTVWAKPDDILEQGRRYAIVVTDAVKDASGDPVEADEGFEACARGEIGGQYCFDLRDAMPRLRAAVPGRRIVGGSLFTTLSSTTWMESARAQATATAPPTRPATPTLLNLAAIARATLGGADAFPAPPATLVPTGGRIAFTTFDSAQFLDAEAIIATLPANAPPPAPTRREQIAIHVFLPATPAPPQGYPVILAGHGLTEDRFGSPSLAASTYVPRGFAVVAMNAVGHGGAPNTTLRIQTTAGASIDLPGGGRAIDVNGDRAYGEAEGCINISTANPIFIRDCLRQTALDFAQLAAAIRRGIDLDGDGRADLDAANIQYHGVSLGAFTGTLLAAVEPAVRGAVLTVGGGSAIETVRLSQSFRPLTALYLAFRLGLIPGVLFGLDFDDEYTGRDEPVKVLRSAGAAVVQNHFERLEWIEAPGAPVNFAPHLRSATLPDVPLKRLLFQMAIGDRVVPNPANSLLVRAANSRHLTSLYRHDLARAVFPSIPRDPHAYIGFFDPPQAALIGAAARQQALLFLLDTLDVVPDVNALVRLTFGRDLFEIPAVLPEQPN